MLYIIQDSVRFPEELATVRTITRRYNMYPRQISTASVAIQGIDYGFSDQEGLFFRSQIQTASRLISPYQVQVDTTFGFRSREFNKRTDAIVNYSVFLDLY